VKTVETTIKGYMDQLQKRGYKYTNQREDVLRILLENKESHLSCEEVHGIVARESKDVGIATVYRTLQLFERLGIVYRINFDDGVSRYELNLGNENHHHHHLICTECGNVTEVKLDLLEALEDEIEKEEGFVIRDHNVKFYGICKKCKNK
jgi:Fur family ferric uptake transcriptional regulator